jgi:uncharacterized YccA/Bax inhibitor family protein
MRSANPALNEKTFSAHPAVLGAEAMTLNGTVNKTGLMLILLLVPAAWTWSQYFNNPDAPLAVMPWVFGGMILGLILGVVTAFKAAWAPVLAPLYSICQGFFLGGLSAIFEARFPGIVIQAVGLTFGTLAALLLAYKSGIIRATENFKLGVSAATGGIFLIYLTSFVLGFFGVNVPYIHESGLIGIGFSLFVVVIAALNLVLDFDFIESGAERGAPKYMEWYGAFGLMVTLIWLYVEFLRLLAKLRSRN